MQTVIVKKVIKAPAERVFDAWLDHEALAQLPMVRSARVVKPGDTEPNGLGAIREVDGGVVWLREEITGCERPRLIEYRIRKSRPASDHREGRVDFAEVPGGTEVTWKTVFGVSLPVIGTLAEPGFSLVFGVVFRLVLRSVEQRATAPQPAVA